MTDDVQADLTAPLTPSSSAPPTGGQAEEWRVPQTDAREWARGMTAAQVLEAGGRMFGALSQMASQPAPVYQAPRNSEFQMPGDDDVVDGKTFKAALAAVASPLQQTQLNADQLASMSVQMFQQKHSKLFAKYGPELAQEIAKLPNHMRTVDNLEFVADVIRGRHIEDLANDRARELAGNVNMSARSNGFGGQPGDTPSLESDALPAEYRDKLARLGVTMKTVESFCRGNGMTVKQWIDSAAKMAPIGDN